ncbi:hypothetical protein E4U13_007824 [Claviceps humidiphila]|uniref:Uncharacterized protein n=1 Tax=Claviceps humidiphila TaxID=1294629 RepID=A0A9P7TTX3_9HYPO|nr:hypothetical protein E4U13_007824 [Claviceps humidiphila]
MTTSMVSPSPAVEEKLSVTTAIIGLLAVGGKTIDILWDLNTTSQKKRDAVLVRALHEVKQCRSTVHVLYKTLSLLELAQLPYPERASWIKAEHLVAILTDTVLAMSDLQAKCETLDTSHPASTAKATAAPSPSGKDDETGVECASSPQKVIQGLCSRIRWHNLSMTMIMTILKCPGESDAQNSRVGLERRMKRLLSAKPSLSAQMRQLDGVFDHNGRLGRENLPHYTLPARHPQFWLLPHLTSYPGTGESPESDGAHTQSSSPLSGYTLADIPILSMIPLPVTTTELTDGALFYTFAYAQRVSHDLGELMQEQTGQGTSRSLGIILGRTSTDTGNGASSSSTDGSSSEGSPVMVGTEPRPDPHDTQTKSNKTKWKVRNLKVRRRWRV